MADPLSAPALALGTISLAFQIFSGCVKGYQLLIDAKGMPKEHDYLRLRLRLEQYRLLDWAVAFNLTESDDGQGEGALIVGTHLNRMDGVEVLREISNLVFDGAEISKRYSLTLTTVRPTQVQTITAGDGASPPLLKKALEYANQAAAGTYPKALRWAVFDADRFQRLLLKLTQMNDSMLCFLDAHQKSRHVQLQQDTHLRVLQLHDRVDYLIMLLRSVAVAPPPSTLRLAGGEQLESEGPGTMSLSDAVTNNTERLVRLARFKAINIGFTQGNERAPTTSRESDCDSLNIEAPLTVELDRDKLELHTQECPGGKPSRSGGVHCGSPVWVEWKYYERICLGGTDKANVGPAPYVEKRVSSISALLRDPRKPPEFPLPECLGYLHEPTAGRFGIVYNASMSTSSAAAADAAAIGRNAAPQSALRIYGRPPDSLYDALARSPSKPSLSWRVSLALGLAEALLYLHATNWLHKSLRSDNVLLLPPGAHPFAQLVGFEYSRPPGRDQFSELPSDQDDRARDMYRHPEVQFDVPRDWDPAGNGFARHHDMYSLGVVLVEIGMWAPVHAVLGIPLNAGLIRRPVLAGIQSKLVGEDVLDRLRGEAGDLFAKVVQRCLLNSFVEEGEGEGGATSVDFRRDVVLALKDIAV